MHLIPTTTCSLQFTQMMISSKSSAYRYCRHRHHHQQTTHLIHLRFQYHHRRRQQIQTPNRRLWLRTISK